ncbi:helix-turn-helix domain-containing protein [Pseudonocardia sp. NPDC049635]|uniref:winged helix-turn-helix transcriptional regulator n=1 Tax=Pseudonocardia sp. NPDC049635 TaxID=3155506 RepID=UPI00340892E1
MTTPSEQRDPEPSDEVVTSVFARRCDSRTALETVGSKWGILALLALGEGAFRFNGLRRKVDGVSERMLARTLQSLERDGLVVREVHSTIPPRVEYSLTPLGRRVATTLRGLADILEGSVPELLEARRRYDDAHPA